MSTKRAKRTLKQQTGAVAATDSICQAIWITSVNDQYDGHVEVKVDAAGKITGNYFSLDANGNTVIGDEISGDCIPGPPRRIHYERTNGAGVVRTYDGRIFPINLGLPTAPITLIIGTHTPSQALGDDDWMGGHTT